LPLKTLPKDRFSGLRILTLLQQAAVKAVFKGNF